MNWDRCRTALRVAHVETIGLNGDGRNANDCDGFLGQCLLRWALGGGLWRGVLMVGVAVLHGTAVRVVLRRSVPVREHRGWVGKRLVALVDMVCNDEHDTIVIAQ
jgi:hypothetical protein